MNKFLCFFVCLLAISASAQKKPTYWQQHGNYTMDVKMDVKAYRYKGTQQLVYTNNSPDTLRKVFY
ncbi:MAG: M1 family peptidase, partial [Chitinophagaceae bacterium]